MCLRRQQKTTKGLDLAAHVGDLDRAPGPWLQPGQSSLVTVTIRRVSHQMRDLYLPPCILLIK